MVCIGGKTTEHRLPCFLINIHNCVFGFGCTIFMLVCFFAIGYGQDMSGFGQSYSDPSQQPPSYTTATTAPASAGPPAGGSGLGRGQNHNVQGFHPYRR